MEQTDQPSTSAKNSQSKCVCVLCRLLEKRRSGISLQEKRDLISSGRHMPSIRLETRVDNAAKKFVRSFKIEYYEKYKWLTGCSTRAKLFCWPCLLFNFTEKSSWYTSGYSDLNNFHKNVKKHVNSKGHLTSMIKEKTFGKTRIEHSLDNRLKMNHKIHNELVTKNRNILKRLIEVICFLGTELGSIGDNQEDGEFINRKNYIGLIQFLGKYDETLNMDLNDSTVSTTSIQKDLIKCVADVVLNSIKHDIKDAAFVSIVLDETTDKSNISQLAVVVRYAKSKGDAIQERFLRYLDVTTDRTVEAMYKIVLDIVEELECGSKLVAQSYDGAAVMADHLGSLQAKIKERFQNAVFVHYFGHRLSLILSQSVGFIKECKVFFSTLRGMAAYSVRTRALDTYLQKISPPVAPTLLNYSERLVETISQFRGSLIEVFKDILDNNVLRDPETVNSARGYLQLVENDFDFNFLLKVFSQVFFLMDRLFDILQAKSTDIDFCVQNINTFQIRINHHRVQFQRCWDETVNLNMELQKKRIKVENVDDTETSYLGLYSEIFDNITQQLKARFQNFNELKFIELCNFSNDNKSRFPEEAFKSLALNYANLFDIEALNSQLKVLYDSPEVSNQKTPLNMLLFLKITGLAESYSEVFKLCQLVLTIPTASASVDRNFSTLQRIKTFVINSTAEERLSNLAVLSIEKEVVQELSQNPKFYEDVIDRFALVNERIELHYK